MQAVSLVVSLIYSTILRLLRYHENRQQSQSLFHNFSPRSMTNNTWKLGCSLEKITFSLNCVDHLQFPWDSQNLAPMKIVEPTKT